MIARLTGTLAETSGDAAVIDVGGVGYLVQLSGRTLGELGPVGGDITVLTELQVREDAWTLFGFGSATERDAFRALTSIQGVGGRLALAILSTLSPDELARAVAQDDKAMIGRANGVGPKLAARITNELQAECPARAAALLRTHCRLSPTSASSPPTPARPSMPPRMSSDPTPPSTRSSGWR
jgi:holliday junction DNA helicase RuvA